MNIFYLHSNAYKAAEMHCDKHVVKMILETAQLLSTAHRELDGDANVDPDLYRKTHKNHPSAKWVRQSNNNYMWAWCLMDGLCKEYTRRYSKTHATETKLLSKLYELPRNIEIGYMTTPPQCMPEEYKTANTVEAYRNYYKGAKKDFAVWKHGNYPEWW
jgi:transposase